MKKLFMFIVVVILILVAAAKLGIIQVEEKKPQPTRQPVRAQQTKPAKSTQQSSGMMSAQGQEQEAALDIMGDL